MGRASEIIAYLNASPSEITQVKQRMVYQTETDELKKHRNELRLWEKPNYHGKSLPIFEGGIK